MITTDWAQNVAVVDSEAEDIRSIAAIKSLSEHPQLLVFPHSFEEYDEDFGRHSICEFDAEKRTLSTKSILGFIGRNGTQLTIRSRFVPGKKEDGNTFDETKDDYFLRYMLQKVFSVNIFDMKHATSSEPVFDFMLYMFPYYLKKALCHGLYREYQSRQYNDANVRGVIDVCRHIKTNIPFTGKVAYSTREYLYDNKMTQLIRHTIEQIRCLKYGANVLGCDKDTRKYVSMIIGATGTYNRNSRQSIINKNLRPFRHSLYYDYEPLRRVCLQILRHESLKYGCNKDEIYGVLFDGAWLWEEYLGIVLKDKFEHFCRNRGKKFYLFENGRQRIIPDYLSKDRKIVADAKYIPLDRAGTYDEEKATAVYYKTVTYMYRWQSVKGYLFYPYKGIDLNREVLNIRNTSGCIIKLGFPVYQKPLSYSDFCKCMEAREKRFIEEI